MTTITRATTPDQIRQTMQELERISKSKKDYIVPAGLIQMQPVVVNKSDDSEPGVVPLLSVPTTDFAGPTLYGVRKITPEQLSDKLGVDLRYYRRMQAEAPELLTTNVNHWLQANQEKNYLVRTLDGDVRSFLSDRYRIMDSYDLAFPTMEIINEVGATVTQMDLSEEKFYMRALHPEWEERIERHKTEDMQAARDYVKQEYGTAHPTERQLNPFERLQQQASTQTQPTGLSRYGIPTNLNSDWGRMVPGIVVSTSEVGRGGLSVEPFIYHIICANGLIGDTKMMKIHLGAQQERGYLSNETKSLQDELLWAEVQDLVRATFDRDQFKEMVAELSGLATKQLAEPIEAVDAVVKHTKMTEERKQQILNQLISGGDSSVFGLIEAVTAVARDLDDPDETAEMQRIGGLLVQNHRELVEVRR